MDSSEKKIEIKNNDNIKNIITSQDFSQKAFVTGYVIMELYRLIISTLLILFVPQNCNGHLCSMSENLEVDSNFYLGGIIINFITFFSYIILYSIEIKREFRIVKYLEFNKELPSDNKSVENALKVLDKSKINKIYFLDNLYEKIGITSVILFFGNTIISGIIINNYSLGSQTYSTFVTNISFMISKVSQIYTLSVSDKNIFYSAYLFQRVQFNDVDIDFKESYKNIENNEIGIELP